MIYIQQPRSVGASQNPNPVPLIQPRVRGVHPAGRINGVLQGSDIAPSSRTGEVSEAVPNSTRNHPPNPLSPVNLKGKWLPESDKVDRDEDTEGERLSRSKNIERNETGHLTVDRRHGVRGVKPMPESSNM